MNKLMQARIIDKETQITKQYIINSFYYDTINGEDYLVLDTEENGAPAIIQLRC